MNEHESRSERRKIRRRPEQRRQPAISVGDSDRTLALGERQHPESGTLGAADLASAGQAARVQRWAQALGNRRLSRLIQRSGETSDLVQREAADTPITVALTFTETARQDYDLTSETLEGIDAELPGDVGQFNHETIPVFSHVETEEGNRVTRVTLPVHYYYIMPRWTRLSAQPQRIQEAWRRFFGDVMVHEQEHLSVSQRYYRELKTTLERLAPEERTEDRVRQEFDSSIERQNAVHLSHAGFTTPASIVFSDYIPEEEEEEEPASPEAPSE